MNKDRLVLAYEADHLLAERLVAERLAYDLPVHAENKTGPLDRLPHIAAVLESRPVFWVLLRIQELVWTLRRAFGLPNDVVSPPAAEPKAGPPAVVRPLVNGPIGYVVGATRPTLLIDVTNAANGRTQSGIRKVALAFSATAVATGVALPIVFDRGVARPFFQGLPFDDALRIGGGDIVVNIDDFWDAFREHGDLLAEARARGATVATCIHDLIPLDYPALVPSYLTREMAAGLPLAIAGSDILFSISRASAADIARYLAETRPEAPARTIGWFHLGMHPRQDGGDVRDQFALFLKGGSTFLSVASLLPHKAHEIALRAFERLWAEGGDERYLIIGRHYGPVPIVDRIRNHPLFGKRLFWVADASDAEVTFAYDHARALLQPSLVEGFGLPMIEAAAYGLPIIASDLPVFHEIVGDYAIYVEPCNVAALTNAISSCPQRDPGSNAFVVQDWAASLAQMRAMLEAFVTASRDRERPEMRIGTSL